MNDSLRPTQAEMERARGLLAAGELVAFPTETVYGLGANALEPAAVEKIYRAKGRPSTNPLIAHLPTVSRLQEVVASDLTDQQNRWLQKLLPLWPGPLTLVLPKSNKIPMSMTAGLSSVAVRIPNHPVALELLESVPFPVAAPSANRSNAVSPTLAAHVASEFSDIDICILEGGPSSVGLESTIVTLMGSHPRVLRHGFITAESLAERLSCELDDLLTPEESSDNPTAKSSPGQMRIHYAPRTPLVFADAWSGYVEGQRVGRIHFDESKIDPADAQHDYVANITLSSTGDLPEVASRLFASLREIDELKLDLIVIDSCDEALLGRAIMDRLRRAVARGPRPDPT